MRSKILVTVYSMVLATGLMSSGVPAFAAEPADSKMAAIEKLGSVRVTTSAKMNDLRKLLDNQSNGATVTQYNLYLAYTQSVAAWQKRLGQENAKPADTRDQALVESLNSKLEKANTMWGNQTQKDAPLYTQNFAVLQDVGTQLTTVVNTLSTLDQNWVRADIDPAQMTSLFQTVSKRIDDAIANSTATIEAYKKLVNDRIQALQQ